MSRTDYLTIAIVAVCVVALFFLIYKFVTLPSGDAGAEQTEQPAPEYDYSPDDPDTTAFADPDLGYDNPASDYSQTGSGQNDDNTGYNDEAPAEKPVAADKTPTAPARVSSGGEYMVLAGSFRETVNAEAMLAKVKKMGYDEATVERFDRGTYAVVLVNRFDTYSEASALVKTLSGKGVDATVYKKR